MDAQCDLNLTPHATYADRLPDMEDLSLNFTIEPK